MAESLTHKILCALPATLPELRAIFGRSKQAINCRLCQLRDKGLVRRSERRGMYIGPSGPKPRIWERT